MKILVYGSGAVGIAIAAALYDSNIIVHILAQGETANKILKEGIIRRGLFKEIKVSPENITVYNEVENIPEDTYDFILVCTKTTASKAVAEDLARNSKILKQKGSIVLFQNGWGNDEYFLEYFSKRKIYSARVITGFKRPDLNISEVTVHAAPILLGSLHDENIEKLEPLAKAIEYGGIPCEVTEDVSKALWAKMLYNCTLNPLGAILNVTYGKLTESENTVSIMNKIIDEIFEVMAIAGYKTYWEDSESYKKEFYEKLIPATYNHRSSTLQDIEKEIKTEIDTLNGSILRLGEKYKLEVPYNSMIYNMIKAKESYFKFSK